MFVLEHVFSSLLTFDQRSSALSPNPIPESTSVGLLAFILFLVLNIRAIDVSKSRNTE